jgi:hypothetical protein
LHGNLAMFALLPPNAQFADRKCRQSDGFVTVTGTMERCEVPEMLWADPGCGKPSAAWRRTCKKAVS